MKKNILYSALILFLTIFKSCDVIEGDYMIDGTTNSVDTTSVVKRVLIEDFTGHRCPNCPSAAAELDGIINTYGDRVIGIAVHPHSNFSIPNPLSSSQYTYDFRTEEGDNIDNIFQMTSGGLPVGMVNRIGFDGNHQLSKDEWGEKVQTELEKEPVFKINLSSDFTTSSGNISVEVEALTDLNNSYNIVVCLTENNIIEWQKDNNIDNENYNHKHVLRKMLNSTFGESIGDNFNSGDIWTKSFNVNISELENQNENYSLNTSFMGNGNCTGWIEDNIESIAYIYDNSNYEIVQVEKIHLKNN
tara:strand:+ start:2234 stop:3139 length:906 start_codon:yes stop_codon:yes gene_type:complete